VHRAFGEQQQHRRPYIPAPPAAAPSAPTAEARTETRPETGPEARAETRTTETGRATVPETAAAGPVFHIGTMTPGPAEPFLAKVRVLHVFHCSLLSYSIGLHSIDDISAIYP